MAGQLWTLDTSLPMSPMTVCCRAAPKRSPSCSLHKHITQVPLTAAIDLPVRPLFPNTCGYLRASSTRAAGVMAAAAVCLGHGRGARSLVLPACGSARLPPALALWGRARRTPPRLHLPPLVKQVRERRWFDPDLRVTTDTFGGEGQDIAVHVAHQGACGHFQRVWMAPLVHEDHEHGAQEARTAVFDAVASSGPPPRAPTGRLPPAGHRASDPAGAGVRQRRRPGGGPPWRTGRSACRASSLQAYARKAPCAIGRWRIRHAVPLCLARPCLCTSIARGTGALPHRGAVFQHTPPSAAAGRGGHALRLTPLSLPGRAAHRWRHAVAGGPWLAHKLSQRSACLRSRPRTGLCSR